MVIQCVQYNTGMCSLTQWRHLDTKTAGHVRRILIYFGPSIHFVGVSELLSLYVSYSELGRVSDNVQKRQ